MEGFTLRWAQGLPKELNLESVFSIKEQRTVTGDNTISKKNRIFQILPDKYRIPFAKAKVEVEKRLDGSIHIKYKDHPEPISG